MRAEKPYPFYHAFRTGGIRELADTSEYFRWENADAVRKRRDRRELTGRALRFMRRKAIPPESRQPFYLYADDESQILAGVAEGTWRELLSRGWRYDLGLTLVRSAPLLTMITGSVRW